MTAEQRDDYRDLAEIAQGESVSQREFDAICNAFPLLLAERDAAVKALKAADAALERLSSGEGFEGAGFIGGVSFPERELRGRWRYAEEKLAEVRALAAAAAVTGRSYNDPA